MDRIDRYRALIRQALCAVAAEIPKIQDIRTEMVCNDEQGHYELLQVGWLNNSRIHGILVHCDILNDKIYIEHNGTDMDIAEIFLAGGVPHSDIVLAFKHPTIRKYTEFALA